MSRCVIVDYGSGNLRSAEKSFQRMADELPSTAVLLSGQPEHIAKADRIVLPGVGAFPACRQGLNERSGLIEAITEAVRQRGAPFLGICVGMQLMATTGTELESSCPGFDWIPGDVIKLKSGNPSIRIPHMGWNVFDSCASGHPVLTGVKVGDHAYFVHSYHLHPRFESDILVGATHGQSFAAAVGRDNLIGTQFHPEKSQATGLRIIRNFLSWEP